VRYPAAERIDRPLDFGQAKPRLGHCGTNIGGQKELEAATYAVAVDRGDNRFRIGIVFQQGVIHHARHFRTGRQIVTDIGADGEGALRHGWLSIETFQKTLAYFRRQTL